ncbi:MAG: flagellar basal-body rod protein FlgF [Gammaproteobacteria bacterium]
MDHVLYIAMTGAQQTMLAQAINANNLANVSTTGFKEDLTAFQGEEVYGVGYPTRVYAGAEANGVNLAAGTKKTTGRELDISINGDGWIAVQAADGTEKYTRAGNMRLSANGTLMTGAGYPVLGNSGVPIAIPQAEKIEIGDDGTVSIRPVGQPPAALATVDRIKLVNPPQIEMEKGHDGLIKMVSGVPAVADASVRLSSGTLENSNVNAVEAMVNMIAMARQFETQVKLMSTAEKLDTASAQLLGIK